MTPPSPLLPLHQELSASLLELHWAVQIPAAASGVLEAQADFSHTNLLIDDGLMVTRPMPDGRRIRLDAATLTLHVGDASLALAGQTVASGVAWLSEQLGSSLSRLEHDLPARPLDKPFELSGGEGQVFGWFALAQRVLDDVRQKEGGGEVRLWPHHFDIATLIEIDEGASTSEEARSINAGLSPGDGSYAEPYFYVTPWPTPKGELPPLNQGHWHRDGFTAAVLTAGEMDAVDPERQAAGFVASAVSACRRALA